MIIYCGWEQSNLHVFFPRYFIIIFIIMPIETEPFTHKCNYLFSFINEMH